MITADQLLAHAVGDYVLQSDWMAQQKTKETAAALAHACVYTLPFILLHASGIALFVICSTHFIIDRFRLARYVVWAKNFICAPIGFNKPWKECSATGYSPERPLWMAVWLLIIADNVICNGLALAYL